MIRAVLTILCVLSFLGGCSVITTATSAIHEIEAFMLFLISAMFFVGGGVLEGIVQTQKKFEGVIESMAATARHTAEAVKALREQLSILGAQQAKSSPPPLGARTPVVGQTYHYSADGAEIGPHTAQDIRELREAGVIRDDTLLFKNGDTQWRAFTDFPELA